MSDHRDADDPYGLRLDGPQVTGLSFLNPYRTIHKLNEQELLKQRRHPFEVAEAIISTYAKKGPEALFAVPGEVERLKWVGIYPQRQGGDAFMMRIKVPGGVLSSAQVREVGLAAEAFAEGPTDHPLFGNHYADITTRQTIQLHWLTMASIPKIWERFARVGLTSIQACGDCARNVTSCPVSGVDPHEHVDGLATAQAISEFFTGNRTYANLPRKFKIAVGSCTENCCRAEINDIALWPATRDGVAGFNVLVGGGLSDGERLATPIDIFITPDQAVELARAIAQLFGELGNRENRGLARMRYLTQELGPERFRDELLARLRFEPLNAGESVLTGYRRDHVGVHPQRQEGLSYVGCVVPVGRMNGRDLVEAARLADAYGDGTVRFTVDQNFILTGVPNDRVDALLAEELIQRYSPNAGPFTRGIQACTGGLELLLHFLGLGLRDLLLHHLRGGIDEVLRLLESESGRLTHRLDDVDLLIADRHELDIELGLLRDFLRCRTTRDRADHDRSRRRHAELLLEHLHELGQVEHAHLFDLRDEFLELRRDLHHRFLLFGHMLFA